MSVTLPGCGGHHSDEPTEVTTGSGGGRLADIALLPAPGTAYISRSATFRLSWPAGTTPPAKFTVALYRYQEGSSCSCTVSSSTDSSASCSATGDVDQGSSLESTDLKPVTDAGPYAYDLKPSGGDDLEAGGIYFVELNTDTEQVRAAYIVTQDRPAAGRAAAAAKRVRLGSRRRTPATGHSVHIVVPSVSSH